MKWQKSLNRTFLEKANGNVHGRKNVQNYLKCGNCKLKLQGYITTPEVRQLKFKRWTIPSFGEDVE